MKGEKPLVGIIEMFPSFLPQLASSTIVPLFKKVGGVQVVGQLIELTVLSVTVDTHPFTS
jgi:hypothetical protein